jgi:hypothetical protein
MSCVLSDSWQYEPNFRALVSCFGQCVFKVMFSTLGPVFVIVTKGDRQPPLRPHVIKLFLACNLFNM